MTSTFDLPSEVVSFGAENEKRMKDENQRNSNKVRTTNI